MKLKYYTLPLLILLACCAFFVPWSSPSKDIKLSDFKLTDLKGKALNPADFKGKKVFLNIWATWCGPCIAEMPSIAKARQSVGNNVVFLIASDEDPERILRFEEKRKTGLPLVYLVNSTDFNFTAIPLTMIFNGNGDMIHRELGARDWASQESLKLINKP